MTNIKNVFQIHNANLLSIHTKLVALCSCHCCEKLKHPLSNEILSESFNYKPTVFETRSQISQY